MSHDAEVLRNPTHKIPPEFARVLSRSYQRYLSENMKMCVSYRVWGQLLFKVEGFISFAWFRICFQKKSDANWTHQGEVPRYYFSEQKLIQGSRHLRPLREEAGRSWEKLRTWKRYAPVPFVCPHHLGQPVHSYKSSAPSSANTFLDAFSQKKKFLDPIFPDIFYWILNLLTVGLPQTFSLVTSSLENPRSKKLLKSRPRATREFSQDVSPKNVSSRICQSDSRWESSSAKLPQKNLDLHRSLAHLSVIFWGWISVCSWEATMVPKVCTALEQQNYGFSKSQRGDLLSVVKHFHRDSMGLAIRPHHMCHLMCSLSLRSSGRDSGREK